MEFIEIQRRLVDTLLKIPAMADSAARTGLLDGMPEPNLVRNYNIPRLDLNSMISGLQRLGRLNKQGGARPVIVVVDNALQYVPEGSEVADELHGVKRDLESYYGGEVQPPPEPVPDEVYEALVFGAQRDNRLPFAFVDKAREAARSVARLTVNRIFNGVPDGKFVYGTGWIIAPDIIITNHHVINARRSGEADATPADFVAQVAGIVARFDYHVETGSAVNLECKGGKLLAQSKDLDYAIIELNEADKIADRVRLKVVSVQPTLLRGSRMNIVQHPQGGPLRYAIRNNFFVSPGKLPTRLWYQTDTEPGASGSPVCGDDWQVVALHHASVSVDSTQVPQEVINGQPVQVKILNEAIKIRDILDSLPAEVKQRIEAAQVG